jgi:heterodisulfide reductase subunit D
MALKTFDLTREMLDHAFPDVVAPDKERLLTCIQCGTCTASCPTAYAMDYTPRQLWRLIQVGLREEVLLSNSFWLCAACYACNTRCPRGIPTMETMLELKVLASRERGVMPLPLRERCQLVAGTHNVAGEDNALRLSWALNLPGGSGRYTGPRRAELAYFVGCYAAFFPLAFGVPQAMVHLLEHLGLSFTTLGTEEWCCGYPLLVAGRREEAAALARHNLEVVEQTGASRLVTACAHCYRVWREIYPQLLPGRSIPPVEHSSTLLLEEFTRQGIAPFPVEAVVTFHDPCDLGRQAGLYEPPRRLLEMIPDLKRIEMANSGEGAICCGGGGNLPWLRDDVVMELGRRRLGQALDVRVSALITACQLCRHTLSRTAYRWGARLRVYDLVELVWSALSAQPLDIPGARWPTVRHPGASSLGACSEPPSGFTGGPRPPEGGEQTAQAGDDRGPAI